MDAPGQGVITMVAREFMLLLAAVNLGGVSESVKFNVVLTLVEMRRTHKGRGEPVGTQNVGQDR
jgi:hypothetical protein